MAAFCDSQNRDTFNPFKKAIYKSTDFDSSITNGKILLPFKYNQPDKTKRLP